MTVKVNTCTTTCLLLPLPKVALSVMLCVPMTDTLLVEVGVPKMVAVPLRLFTKCKPRGSFPVFLIEGVGDPTVDTVCLNSDPAVA